MNKNANTDEHYREVLRKRLGGFEMPVRDDVWSRIESTLDGRAKQKALWAWIPKVVSVAAAAVLLLILFPVNNQNHESFVIKSLLSCIKTERKSTAAKTDGGQLADTSLRINSINRHKYTENQAVWPDTVEPVAQEEYTENVSVENPVPAVDIDREAPSAGALFEEAPVVLPKRKTGKGSIGLSLGSGGSALAMNGSNIITSSYAAADNPFSSAPAPMRSSSLIQERLDVGNFQEKLYLPPVSFGLSVTKELNSRFAVETGITYTYIRSQFKNDISNRRAYLELHYLGIPLNVQARIIGDRFSRWAVYISGGGMVEKGIYAHYRHETVTAEQKPYIFSSNDNIDGLQFSISVAPGIEYRLSKKYSFYVEPRFGYYFDNDQPVSARTERPVVFGLNGGLRYCW
jgi:hypothetical protein